MVYKLRTLILFFFLANGVSLFGQDPVKTVDLRSIDQALLEDLFLKKINVLRVSLGKPMLGQDKVLGLAAADQASYMKMKDKVTHYQDVKGKEEPYKRVQYYKGAHGGVGENCLMVFIGIPTRTNYSKDTMVFKTYAQTAEALFQVWKNSPGHYKNMIDSTYGVTGLGFASDPVTHKLYAAEVFGQNPPVLPVEFTSSQDAFGVMPPEKGKCTYPPEYDFITSIFSNYLVIEGNKVYQYYRDLNVVNGVLSSPRDGLAVDIVKRDQFVCDQPNQLNGSPVFDGMMLKPVYYTQLMKNNQYASRKEFKSLLGELPAFFNEKEYRLNTVLIKDGRQCRYSFPVSVVARQLQLLELSPVFNITSGLARKDSFDLEIEHLVPFERGQVKMNDHALTALLKKINRFKGYILDVRIQTFSSVEGSTEANLKLQNRRAEEIKNSLSFYLNGKTISWDVQSKENWDAFFEQIGPSPFAYLKACDKQVIKEKLKNKGLLDSLEFILKQSRSAVVKIHVKGSYSGILSPELSLVALKRAIQENDPVQAWIIQSQMIYHRSKGDVSLYEMSQYDVPLTKEFFPVYANMLGCKAFDDAFIIFPSNGKKVLEALRSYPSDFYVRFNACVYALKYWALTADTLFDPGKLEDLIAGLAKMTKDTLSVNRLLMNYYVMGAYHYYMVRQYEMMDHCLQQIWRIYPSADITEQEAIDLAKLFNMYYRFDWAMPVMYPFVKKPGASEELIFTFVRTGALYRWSLKDDEYFALLKKARQMNNLRFCEWINTEDFQLMRDSRFKDLYCKSCGN
jgi:uncharacterized protein YkwD